MNTTTNPYHPTEDGGAHETWERGNNFARNHWGDPDFIIQTREGLDKQYCEGYDAHQAPFDPSGIDVDDTHVNLTMWDATGANTISDMIPRVLYSWQGYVAPAIEGTDAPDWSHNRPENRSVPLNEKLMRTLTYRTLRASWMNGTVELPCPPYSYEPEAGSLTITAGAFRKSGGKHEWQNVINEMQEQVDAMPESLDVEDTWLTIDCEATFTYQVRLELSTLVEGDERMDGENWHGTLEELENAADNALDGLDSSELAPDGTSDPEPSYYGDVEASFSDYSSETSYIE